MKKEPLITVVVAIYNGEKFLQRCVDSITKRTYKNLEIILVDDGSTDSSNKLCDEFAKADKRIIAVHKKNGGVSSARNLAIQKMSGEWLCIVDQDDWIEKDYVEYLYNLTKKYGTEVSIVPQIIFTTQSKTWYNEKNNVNYSEKMSGEKISCFMLNDLIEISPWSKIVSKNLIDREKIKFDTELFGGEGYLFSIDAFMNSRNGVAVGYKGIYHYVIDNYNSEMSQFRIRTANSSFKTTKILQEKYHNISKNIDTALQYATWNAYYTFLIKMIACNEHKKHQKEFKTWKKYLRKNISSLVHAHIPIKTKNKQLFVTYFTSVFMFARTVKKTLVKRENDRDYTKIGDNS